jgi:hypothetical protein
LNHHAFLYQHAKRPEWGYGAVTEAQDDRTTFKFDDGASRTIKRDHIHMMLQVELDEPEATEVHKRIAKHSPAKTAATEAKLKKAAAKKASTKKAAAAKKAGKDAEAPAT